ncbi:MAG: efflux RND transporter periplasmic adaptor subunit [Bacteroidia bacterium]|jgi:HlyD family secretion protein|nr:efflux RND transporter periplasmic adaptor subunit [Bacteroidia bacterium]
MKRIWWIIIGGLLLLILILIAQNLFSDTTFKVAVEEVKRRDIIETVTGSGKIQPETEVKITSDVSGEIIDIYVKEGDKVQKGQLLCRIRPDIYQSALDRTLAQINSSKAQLEQVKAQLEQAKANLANTQSIYERNKKLYEQKAISLQEYQASESQYLSALANIKAMEESIKSAEYNIKSLEASYNEAKSNLDKTFIYSPVDATVSKLNVEKGERVQGVSGFQGTEIMRLANLNEMEVKIDISENDIIRVHKNDTAIIEIDAYEGELFKGVVTDISNSVNSATLTADQLSNYTVKVRILYESYKHLINPENPVPIRPGMSASVDIQTKKVRNVLSIPIQAVTIRNPFTNTQEDSLSNQKNEINKKNKKEYVFVVKENKAKAVIVKTGIQDNQYIEIVEGLKDGDKVIVEPFTAIQQVLKDNQEIKVVSKEELLEEK